MAFDRMKCLYLFICYFLKPAHSQVRFGNAVRNITQHPFQALVRTYWQRNNPGLQYDNYDCGGVIIHRRYILTAAHCVKSPRFREGQWRVIAGTMVNVGSTAMPADGANLPYLVTETLLYDTNFVYGRKDAHQHDIALLKLDVDLPIDNMEVARAILGNPESPHGDGWECSVSGWGQVNFVGDTDLYYPEQLMEGVVITRNERTCVRPGHENFNDEERQEFRRDYMICTAGANYNSYKMPPVFYEDKYYYEEDTTDRVTVKISQATAPGDSGGPLSCYPRSREYLNAQQKSVYGITAFGTGSVACNGYQHIGVGRGRETRDECFSYFMKISSYIEEIMQTVSGGILLDGMDAAMGQFPFQALILRQTLPGTFMPACSATILAPNSVITSSFCRIFNENKAIFRVIAGEVDFHVVSPSRQTTSIREVITEERFKFIRLSNSFNFNEQVSPAAIPEVTKNQKKLIKDDCTVSSWEMENTPHTIFHSYLQWKQVRLHNHVNPWNSNLEVEEIFKDFRRPYLKGPGMGAGLTCANAFDKMAQDRDRVVDPNSHADLTRYLVGIKERYSDRTQQPTDSYVNLDDEDTIKLLKRLISGL